MRAVFASDFELKNRYREIFNGTCSNPISDEYLRRSRVRVFLSDDGEIVAGYIVNTTTPIRYFDWIRGEEWLRSLDEGQASELTCIWMDKKRIKPQQRRNVYMTAVWDALRAGKPYVVGGSVAAGVARIQMRGFPRLLYAGKVHLPDRPEGWVYFAPRWTLFLRVLCVLSAESLLGAVGIEVGSKLRAPKRKLG